MKKRLLVLPVLSLISLVGAGYLVFFTEPSLLRISLFFFLLFIFYFLLFIFLLRNSRRGLFIAVFLAAVMVLQFFRLTNWLTLGLLASPFVLLEIYFSGKN